ncbi:stable inheritance protein KleA [Variovorax sp. CAN15]|uniref:stable inheritance protein KleA n=1 Tax=Variovorax sp. CAN15 TaxID=3046727 RepID=UPI002647FD34|nr:stable inheritance protein KleA [Variovorax sp. CAN15]
MEWVERLPEVGTPLLRRVERIAAVLVEANDLQKKAVELQQVAYLECLQLERDVAVKWSRRKSTGPAQRQSRRR